MNKLDVAHYDVLEVRRDADDATIKKAFKKAVLKAHPDKGGSSAMFQLVNEAYTVLSDVAQRAQYDRDLKRYNLKDGLGQATHKEFQRQASLNREQKEADRLRAEDEQRRAEAAKEARKAADAAFANIDIPDDFEKLGVKALKELLDKLGVRRDDCFEKEDLQRRLREYKQNKGKPPAGGAKPRSRTENTRKTYASPGGDIDMSKFEMPKPANLYFKIISVGNQEVGKSCLIKRYCEGRFVKRYISTIGIDYGVKKLDCVGHKVCVNFFDLSGNDEYKDIRAEFYKDASGCIAVFDVDNRDSYISLVHWEEEMRRQGADMNRLKVVVCGNKCDSKSREVKEVEAIKWARQRDWDYFETSAAEGKNVNNAFEHLFQECVKQFIDDKKKFGL